MSSDAKAVVCVACIVGLTIMFVVGVHHVHDAAVTHEAMKNGYVQQQLPGKQGVYWTKP